MRFTGHLDLHHTWERTFRRARLPLAYSQGFNPHPHINLACALPLGFTSENEIVDVWLDERRLVADIEAALIPALPPGLKISRIEEIESGEPTLQTELLASKYLITFLEEIQELEKRVQEILSADTLPRQRREKDYDLRPLILDLQLHPSDSQGRQRLLVCLSAREAATGRPEEVIAVLGASPNATRVHRIGLIFRSKNEVV